MKGAREMTPRRVQLSRKKGWKLPPNTIVVSRPSKLGNPFIVGTHGKREECVWLFKLLCAGYLAISVEKECIKAQKHFIAYAEKHIKELRGKNLACWCPLDAPCHADVLLKIANSTTKKCPKSEKLAPWPKSGSKPGDTDGAYVLCDDGWWRLRSKMQKESVTV